ncbi:cupin domain-containing protein [Lachnoclostridium sp.]|uniref:cupin domain-containing protein n=1 Tax=Lachnoclostridium sp. TaxID=2028282 RepID=UPI00289E7C33|nr:cupin domain-containing protein [Lachnoclostridium sp.]
MNDEILIINEENLIGKRKAEHQEYEFVKYEVTPRKDFNQCYLAIYEIPPKKANYPYHYHKANTEAFYILSGQGILKTYKGDRNIQQGDIIVCPPCEAGAHKIINTSTSESLKYIDFDTKNSPDIIHYPDSDKVGIILQGESSTFFKNANKTNYYEGE